MNVTGSILANLGETTLRGIEWRVILRDADPRAVDPTIYAYLEYRLPRERYFHDSDYYRDDTGRALPKTIRAWAMALIKDRKHSINV